MTATDYEARIAELEAEVARLRAFNLRLAEHLFLAAEVLSIRAEKDGVKKAGVTDSTPLNSVPVTPGRGGTACSRTGPRP